jgi:hypothetical protein
MESVPGPYKICNQTAESIRSLVEQAKKFDPKGRISPGIAKILRQAAERDQLSHQSIDPEYNLGGGPANLKEREK